MAKEGYEVHYIILRASREETEKRAAERSKLNPKTNAELVAAMWEPFCGLGKYEAYVIDTTKQTSAETAAAIKACVRSGENRIR